MTRNELLNRLSELELQEKAYKRMLDIYYYDYEKRTHYFNLLKKTHKEIPKIKFQLRLCKEIERNDKNRNTSSTKNKEK